MYRLFLFLLLLPASLLAQNQSFPTPGKAVGLVVSDVTGEWGVLSQDFTTAVTPIPLEGGKVCWFEAPPGNYAVIQSGTGGHLRVSVVRLAVGPLPPPPPIPPPDPPPDPPVPPPPIPGVGLKVLILYETEASLGEGYYRTITSPILYNYLNAKCTKDQFNNPRWRKWDDDYSAVHLSGVADSGLKDAYFAAIKTKPDNKPWLVVSTDTTGESIPLPPTLEETMAVLQKYGGP